MIYLDQDQIIIPKINVKEGDTIKFVNQVTKEEYVDVVVVDGFFYIYDSSTNFNGQYDYFIYASNSPLDILQTGVASSLSVKDTTTYKSNINIKTYNG